MTPEDDRHDHPDAPVRPRARTVPLAIGKPGGQRWSRGYMPGG